MSTIFEILSVGIDERIAMRAIYTTPFNSCLAQPPAE